MKESIEEIKQFATQMPLSTTGAIFVWYFILKKFHLTPSAGVDIDPESIFRHLMLKGCGNDTTLTPNLSGSLSAAIKLQTDIAELRNKSSDIPEEDGELDDVLKERGKRLQVAYTIMVGDLKKGGCNGFNKDKPSRCLYSNTGTYDNAAAKHTLDIDARVIVAPTWVRSTKPDLSFEAFYCNENYMNHQPGMAKSGLPKDGEEEDTREENDTGVNSKRRRKDRTSHSTDITSLFAVEGEFKYDLLLPDSTDDYGELHFYNERYAIHSQNITTELDTLYNLHKTCFNPTILGTKRIRIGLTPHECLWCTLSISAGTRRVLHDLLYMAREKALALGMDADKKGNGQLLTGDQSVTTKFHYGTANECEEEYTKKVPTQHELRKKGRRAKIANPGVCRSASKQPSVLYTLNFEGLQMKCEPISHVFQNWAEVKYPFLHDFFNKANLYENGRLQEELRSHSSSDGNVFCICNNRRVFSDADCYSKPHHVCLLPFIVQSAQTIVELFGIAKSGKMLTGKLNELTARHHMFPHIKQ